MIEVITGKFRITTKTVDEFEAVLRLIQPVEGVEIDLGVGTVGIDMTEEERSLAVEAAREPIGGTAVPLKAYPKDECIEVNLDEKDANGHKWDARIHTKLRTKTGAGAWKLQRVTKKVDRVEFEALVELVRGEKRGLYVETYEPPETPETPAPPETPETPETPEAPETPAPPAPPAPPEPPETPETPAETPDPTTDHNAWFLHINQDGKGMTRFSRIPLDCEAAVGATMVQDYAKLPPENRKILWDWVTADVAKQAEEDDVRS